MSLDKAIDHGKEKRPGIREFAAKHGIDLSKVRERPDIIDVMTGKRTAADQQLVEVLK